MAELAVLALGAACLVAALAAEGGRFKARLDLLANFAPLWAAGAFLALAYAMTLARRGWRLRLAAVGVAGLVSAGVLILPELLRTIPQPAATPGETRITLIQFNAWERNRDPERAAAWLAARNPDLIAMEDAEPLISRALEARGFHFTRGIADTAIFSRAPVAPGVTMVPQSLWPFLPSFARAAFATDKGDFSLITTHLVRPYDPSQPLAAQALSDLAGRFDRRRLIVAGDFNLAPWTFGLRRLDADLGVTRRDRALFSWPALMPHLDGFRSPAPFLPIDHVYAGPAWRTVSIERGPNLGSDHYPLVVTLALEQ